VCAAKKKKGAYDGMRICTYKHKGLLTYKDDACVPTAEKRERSRASIYCVHSERDLRKKENVGLKVRNFSSLFL